LATALHPFVSPLPKLERRMFCIVGIFAPLTEGAGVGTSPSRKPRTIRVSILAVMLLNNPFFKPPHYLNFRKRVSQLWKLWKVSQGFLSKPPKYPLLKT
jgi:hypothetical protein